LKDLNISVVIPNYNGVHLFPETLPPLIRALEESGKQFEIIISDDCSTDNSLAYLKQNFPEISILTSDTNSGFSITINKGIALAKYQLVLLLNSDVKLSDTYFINQFKYFNLPDTFGVMGQIIGWEDNIVQDGAKYPKFEGFKLKTSGNYFPDGQSLPAYSMYLSGANALVDREKLLQLKGFDELFSPFYMEDVDLSMRAWRVGWKCYFEPEAICRHRTSTSIKSKNKKNYIRSIYNRNKMYFHAIHLKGLWLAAWFVQTLLELLFRMITFRFDYVMSFAHFLRNLKGVRRSRARLSKLAAIEGKLLSFSAVINTMQGSARES
jgi:GT2 family glycosyltransferase